MTRKVAVFGAGPAGLIAAETLASAGFSVGIHDRMAAPARKLLLAGRGGLNLTHSEPLEQLLERYGSARTRLEPAIRNFSPAALRAWCEGLGIETFVGTSGRVFPRCMKASPLLRAWLRRLEGLGVTFYSRSPWHGFGEVPSILALGGASWPQLGSDAAWVAAFSAAHIRMTPFAAANVRQKVAWSDYFAGRFAGTPLKNIELRYGAMSARGEAMISKDGIEGGAIYALSAAMVKEPAHELIIDLRPETPIQDIAARYEKKRAKDSHSNFLRKAFGLSPVAIALMHETKATTPKQVVLKTGGAASLERAISSAGGVNWDEIGEDFQLIRKPSVFVAGEMLDWSAPTGGYLLQACFATGVAAAKGLMASL